MKLYNFQEDILLQTKVAMFDSHRHILIQSPTGSGKTVIFSSIVESANVKNKKCLILTDRIELLYGAEGTASNFGIHTEKVLRGAKYPPRNETHTIAMSQTLRRRIDNAKWNGFFNLFDIIIIDEAHVQEFNVYFEKIAFKNKPYILGFTATPKRSKKQRKLSDDYSILIPGLQIPELIKMNFLVKDKYYAPRHFDTNDIKLNSFGDFKEDMMFKKITEKVSYNSVVNNWETLAKDTITLIFCVNIEHTIRTCIKFNENGYSTRFLVSPISRPKFDDDFTDEQFIRYQHKVALYKLYVDNMAKFSGNRNEIISEWKQGKFKILVNVGIFTKGFDYPAIQTIVVWRATTSETLWLQILGRGSRTSNGKDYFIILDFGSNAERLGLYNQEREWHLHGNFSTSEGVAPVKECGVIGGKTIEDKTGKTGCGNLILASRKICNYCGYQFEQEKVEVDVDLIHIDYTENTSGIYENIDFVKLEQNAEERGYRFGWVINRIIADGGLDALKAYSKYKEYKYGWVNRVEKQYNNAIKKYNAKMQDEVLSEHDEVGLLF